MSRKKKSRRNPKRWIQSALKKHKRGALHRQLGIPEDQAIPLKRLQSAAKKPGLMGQRARLALNLRRVRRKRR